jgi:hypothetical protein
VVSLAKEKQRAMLFVNIKKHYFYLVNLKKKQGLSAFSITKPLIFLQQNKKSGIFG